MFSAMDFNRKVSTEKELEKSGLLRHSNIVFDKSNNFLAYASMAGIKVFNLVTKKGTRLIGKTENLRLLNIALFQV